MALSLRGDGVSYTILVPKYPCLPSQALGRGFSSSQVLPRRTALPGMSSDRLLARVTYSLPGCCTVACGGPPGSSPGSAWRGTLLAWKDRLHYGGNGTESRMGGLLHAHSSTHRDALPVCAVFYAVGD